jgi:acetate kinase
VLLNETGHSLKDLLKILNSQSGLLGLSGLSGDVRDLETAASQGDPRARLALDVFITSIRHCLGAYLMELGGADVIVFTGGIGENSVHVRSGVCAGLEEFGIVLDTEANARATGECAISSAASRTQIWIMHTNEELVVARQCLSLLSPSN